MAAAALFRGRALVCKRLSADFRSATEVVSVELRGDAVKPHQVLVRNCWAGVNASDVNFTAGRYHASPPKLPMHCGFEAVAEVVVAGAESGYAPGDAVAVTSFGAFADYQIVPSHAVLPLPALSPFFLPLVVSGITASIGLECVGDMCAGDVVLVTAAAGGTGQYAVQLAKRAGCRVFGTCSSPEKVAALRLLGCDRPIDTSCESLDAVLRAECPAGVNLVYESVGGDVFATAARHLAVKGRLVVIGFISGYLPAGADGLPVAEGSVSADAGKGLRRVEPSGSELGVRLLTKSASVRGFFLPHYASEVPAHFAKLVAATQSGELRSGLDASCAAGRFSGIESVADAVDYLYSRRSIGKVCVALDGARGRVVSPASGVSARL
jgi:prostaglandin reductase 3